MLTERKGGKDERASGLAFLNSVYYFPSADTCHIVKTKALCFCYSHLK